MSDSIELRFLQTRFAALERENDSLRKKGDTGGGNPPGGGDMDKRVEALEKAIPEIREKLVRVETKLESVEKNMATKADMSDLRTEMAGLRGGMIGEIGTINQSVANFRTEITRLEGTMIKWFIGTALVLSGGIGAIAFGLARALR